MKAFVVVVLAAVAAGVLLLSWGEYHVGRIEQREHDQKCLATDASWADVSRCIG